MNLQLSLKKKWFEMTKSGEKTEDYREVTPYWCSRLLLQFGEKRSCKFWLDWLKYYGIWGINERQRMGEISFVSFDQNLMTLGYPKKDDKERVLSLLNDGVFVGEGKVKWGAEPNVFYFVIKHLPTNA